jgi:hypothetical protein
MAVQMAGHYTKEWLDHVDSLLDWYAHSGNYLHCHTLIVNPPPPPASPGLQSLMH